MSAAPRPDVAREAAALLLRAHDAGTEGFAEITRRAPARFAARDWNGLKADAIERLELYRKVLDPAIGDLSALLGPRVTDRAVWTEMKEAFAALLRDRTDVGLAETFFNSASRRIFHTVGVDPRVEFVSAEVPTLSLEDARLLADTFSGEGGTATALWRILEAHPFAVRYEDASRDARRAAEKLNAHLEAVWGAPGFDSAEVLRPVFFRNKGAYVVGRIRRGERSLPLLLALLNRDGRVVVDAVLADEDEASIVFSFTRSYFHVDVENASALVAFLKTIMPRKPVAELYTALGFNKHGKTELYRDLLRHIASSDDAFVFAPGEVGMVMIVFTLPSYDVVFKVIRDTFAPPKTTSRKDVLEKYRLVFRHGRAGRLVDVQEFEHLEFPVSRFDPALLGKLRTEAAETVEVVGDRVVLHHLFTERRLTPLNLFLREAEPEAARGAVADLGEAIRDLARVNIFPGDLLLKNFGLTRHGRVVFYDYDEIEFLTDVNFREMPRGGDDDGDGGEPSFFVGENDVFPEEFLTFLGLRGAVREAFLDLNRDLLGIRFWRETQRRLRAGEILDLFSYPEARRLPRSPGPD
ncbi:MAG TPA: bifunctional isocitrate dehydrogenase kinase/phosphatase [Thermoanaerobaculia bacterium]|nr:bifunctional isocitrate dehydrogenase kinase/phosphatase [Thermoanaerobaculia bacterium]HQR67156.1 bifunctional isocitrate dehydrogenase kinase/phosphatase [Thermoanaerobaculia bacterium]